MKHLVLSSLLTALCASASAQFTQERRISENEPYVVRQQMHLSVTDASTMELVNADVLIKGLNPRKTVAFEAVADTSFEIKNYRLYTVSCVEKGFMYYNAKFWPSEAQTHEQVVELKPIAVGLKTDIRDITFLGDKTEIYHKSKPTLEELIDWMTLNPTVKIAVIGHVNGPDNNKSQKFYNKASTMRAKAVVDYLIAQGIDSERLEAKGAGNTEMLFPEPNTDWEHEANRRIEIEVVGL